MPSTMFKSIQLLVVLVNFARACVYVCVCECICVCVYHVSCIMLRWRIARENNLDFTTNRYWPSVRYNEELKCGDIQLNDINIAVIGGYVVIFQVECNVASIYLLSWHSNFETSRKVRFIMNIVVILHCLCRYRKNSYITSKLRVKYGNEVREIKHFWFDTWPDHGVPEESWYGYHQLLFFSDLSVWRHLSVVMEEFCVGYIWSISTPTCALWKLCMSWLDIVCTRTSTIDDRGECVIW
jgi:hypothetical protein